MDLTAEEKQGRAFFGMPCSACLLSAYEDASADWR